MHSHDAVTKANRRINMGVVSKLPLFRPTVALLVILLTGGVASAVTNDLTVEATDLEQNRTAAKVTGRIECTTGTTTGTANMTVYIFQSVGRLLNIGIGTIDSPVNCSGAGASDSWEVTVNAIEGLRFQPGPATVLIRVETTVDGTVEAPSEKGFKARLKN